MNSSPLFSRSVTDPPFPPHSQEELNAILERSAKAYQQWKDESFKKRASLMQNAANLLKANREEFARTITAEMGKVIKQSRLEIDKSAMGCSYYAENAHHFLKNETISSEGSKSYITYNSLGPILAVMPWNFPFWQVIRFAAPALMTGNTGVLKHASLVPACARLLEILFLEAGFPEGVFQTLFVEGSKMQQVIEDPRIKAVTTTGSEQAGSKVAEAAGRSLKKTVLELGGSDPFIVLEDADLEFAVENAVKGRMVNTGQSCIAAKRFIVAESLSDRFVAAFKEKMLQLKCGNPFNEESDYGPLAKKEFAEALHRQVMSSVEAGAKIILGGRWTPSDEAYYPATILTEVKPGTPAYEEELFGPVASVIAFKDEKEAIEIANDTKYGLGASIWTRDKSRAEQMASRIESGSVFINKIVASDPNLPFGGTKASGHGRELSYLGIREFTNIKTISVA